MGYELNRFEGDVDEELICPICSGVLEEPLQVHKLKSIAPTTQTFHLTFRFYLWIKQLSYNRCIFYNYF